MNHTAELFLSESLVMRNITAYQQWMLTPKKVVITTHHNPDADALGSSLAWANFLKKNNHQVKVITPNHYPSFLYWMNGNGEVLIYSEENKETIQEWFATADLVCYLDFSTYHRLQDLENYARETSAKTLLIDHHEHPEIEPDFMFWDVKASATTELVYELIELLGSKNQIDISLGEYIYAGIVTDTSSFKHPSTTPKSHYISAQLLEIGVDTNKIQRLIYDSNSTERIRFLGYALNEKLRVLPEFKTAYFVITLQELEAYKTQQGDTEGLVNYAISIEGILFAALIVERPDCVKVSFRSVGDLAVSLIAEKHFSGGGHKNAAGGTCGMSVEEVEQKLLNLLPSLGLFSPNPIIE